MAVTKEGLLRKRVNYFRVYQKFYVCLRDGRIDLLNEKTRELLSSIVLSAGFTVSELSRTHKKPVGGISSEPCAFSIFNGENLLARFMADTTESAASWKEAIEKAIAEEDQRPRSKFLRKKRSEHVGDQPTYIAEKIKIASKVAFQVVDNVGGLNVYRETNMTQKNLLLKAGCVINDSCDNVMKMILNDTVNDEGWDEWEERLEILEEQEEKHLRVEHVRWYPIKVNGIWTKARDFVLQRYWMSFDNGAKMITWRSCTHPKAPADPNYVRGNIWMCGFLLSPQKSSDSESGSEQDTSCWVDFCVHFSPEGWLGKCPRYFHQQWAYPLLTRLTLLRDAVDRNKFVTVDYQYIFNKLQGGGAGAAGSVRNLRRKSTSKRHLRDEDAGETTPLADIKATTVEEGEDDDDDEAGGYDLTGAWDSRFWTQIPFDKEPLKVRGKNYLHDKQKINCDNAMFKCVAVDLFETEGRVTHIASRPDSLVPRLVKEGGHPFIFLVHFTLPGPPFYSFVVYFAATPDKMTVGNPFGDLLNEFLNAETKEFRDSTFKFIPRVVQGNFFVRKAVGTTPAILGKKLEQEYYGDGQTYFELVVDVGSSAIAGSILGVVKGYATTLQIDLAFLLEGHKSDHLPEQLLGGVRLVNPDIDAAVHLPFYALPNINDEFEKEHED